MVEAGQNRCSDNKAVVCTREGPCSLWKVKGDFWKETAAGPHLTGRGVYRGEEKGTAGRESRYEKKKQNRERACLPNNFNILNITIYLK